MEQDFYQDYLDEGSEAEEDESKIKKKKIEQDLEWDQRQFDILVDALWEVIRDYMENKNNEEIYDE